MDLDGAEAQPGAARGEQLDDALVAVLARLVQGRVPAEVHLVQFGPSSQQHRYHLPVTLRTTQLGRRQQVVV